MPTSKITREKTRRVELLLIPETYEKLKKVALSDGLTMTAILKMALKKYLKEEYNIDYE